MASCSIVISLGAPTLKTSPAAAGVSSSVRSAATVSWTWQKLRCCWPSPWTVSGSPRERLTDEGGHDHPEVAGLARADAVEEPNDDRLEASVLPVGVREDLVDGLRGAVRPAGDERGAEDPVGVLGDGAASVLAVDLGGRGEERASAVAGRCLEDVLGAADVGEKRLERALHDELHADGGGQVDHDVVVGGEPVDERRRP